MTRPMTLHVAMETVLGEPGGRFVPFAEVADLVDQRALYQKRMGTPVQPDQIRLRARLYEYRFQTRGDGVRRRPPARPCPGHNRTDVTTSVRREDGVLQARGRGPGEG